MSDRIEKSITIAAPVERVWTALTDHRQFGSWFQVALDQPFAVGAPSTGQMTYPGYEQHRWDAEIVEISPPTRFVYRWPAGADSTVQQPKEEWTTVTFTLAPVGEGTLVTVVEDGFDRVPEPLRSAAIRSNTGGWEEQLGNVSRYVSGEVSRRVDAG